MPKPLRIAASAVITLGCAAMVLLLASQTTMTYSLPPRTSGGEASKHVTTFGPAVVGTGLVVALTVAAAGWLVWNVVRTPPSRLWPVAALLLIAAVVVQLVVAGMARPTF
ncbi:hypothetical protein [Microlunatus soli]|uniref:hypothetical protein n=1 Tax=Microlunatus soli TaxID=630515 RepID=UPI0012FAE8B3|nr:hypothetical protein [Microlunatus soli]